MADKKISALTAATTPLAGTEVLPIVQSGSTVKVSVANLTAGRAVSTSTLQATGSIDTSAKTDAIALGVLTGTSNRANLLIRGTNAAGNARTGYVGLNIWGTAGSLELGNNVAGLAMSIDGASGNISSTRIYAATVGATNRAVYVDNTGLVGYVSSILASKTNIEDFNDSAWLDELRPVIFNYRKRDEEGAYTDDAETPLEYGLIAEEVETVNPELVFYDQTENGQELRGVSYSKLIVPLLAEIQSLRSRVEKLEQ